MPTLFASPLLLEEVCCSALDHAKLVFKSQRQGVSNNSVGNDHGASGSSGSASLATRMAVKRKLSMITQYVLKEALWNLKNLLEVTSIFWHQLFKVDSVATYNQWNFRSNEKKT